MLPALSHWLLNNFVWAILWSFQSSFAFQWSTYSVQTCSILWDNYDRQKDQTKGNKDWVEIWPKNGALNCPHIRIVNLGVANIYIYIKIPMRFLKSSITLLGSPMIFNRLINSYKIITSNAVLNSRLAIIELLS